VITLLPYLISAAVSILALTGGYFWAESRGYERCREEVLIANARAEKELGEALQAEWARGQKLSAELALKERQMNNLRAEYMTYANAITGHCPADLGVLTAAASAGDKAPVPTAPGPSADPASTVAASAIAANLATNFPRCHACLAQLNALIDWHGKEGVK
jgi:hypothetical protein